MGPLPVRRGRHPAFALTGEPHEFPAGCMTWMSVAVSAHDRIALPDNPAIAERDTWQRRLALEFRLSAHHAHDSDPCPRVQQVADGVGRSANGPATRPAVPGSRRSCQSSSLPAYSKSLSMLGCPRRRSRRCHHTFHRDKPSCRLRLDNRTGLRPCRRLFPSGDDCLAWQRSARVTVDALCLLWPFPGAVLVIVKSGEPDTIANLRLLPHRLRERADGQEQSGKAQQADKHTGALYIGSFSIIAKSTDCISAHGD